MALNFSLFSSPSNLKENFSEINFYERIHDLNASDINSAINPENRDPESEISEETIQKIIDSVSPTVLQSSLEESLDSVYSSVKNQSSTIDIDLKKIKQDVIADQPTEMAAELEKTIPNVYQIQQTEETKDVLSIIFNKIFQYLGLMILTLFFVIAVLLAKGARSKCRTASLLFLLFGIISISIYAVTNNIGHMSEIAGSDQLSEKIARIFTDLINKVILDTSQLILVWGLVAFGLTILLFALSYIFPKPDPEPGNEPIPDSEASSTI